MLIVNGPSTVVAFQLDHRIGGAISTQSPGYARAAAVALAEKIGL